jgi:hypothetical protein
VAVRGELVGGAESVCDGGGVLVARGGTVGGFNTAASVKFASTVWAAAVNTASAPSESDAPDGKLQAPRTSANTNMTGIRREFLDICSSSLYLVNIIVSQAEENCLAFHSAIKMHQPGKMIAPGLIIAQVKGD